MEKTASNDEVDPDDKDSQGGFVFGSGFAFISGFLVMGIGFAVPLDPFGFWNIVIIALSLPIVAGSLVIRWKRSGMTAKANGALTILGLGVIVMLGVTIWFISVLNSLGN